MGNAIVAWAAAAMVVCVGSLALAGGECEAGALHPARLVSFVSGQDIPESVTEDEHGNLYVSLGNTIQQRAPGGQFTVFATLPAGINALGVKVGPDGCVYNASTSLSAVPGAFVWRACSANSLEVFAELDQSGAPNDLSFDDQGDLFVTDPLLGRVWKVDQAGHAQVFSADPALAGDPGNPALVFRQLGVNGVAFERNQRALYLSNTDQGSILRINLRAHDHTPTLFAHSELLRGADGIAFDQSGVLLVAVNAQDSVVAVGRRGEPRVLAQGGLLDAPSSLVFGTTSGDRHQLYLMSSAFSRTLGLQPGTPAPALLRAPVTTPGLPLF
jgi:sugar lactone lactonase YvrE